VKKNIFVLAVTSCNICFY